MVKGSLMVQLTNFQRIERFANPTQLYISYEKSGSIHLVKPDPTAISLAGWLTDKIQAERI